MGARCCLFVLKEFIAREIKCGLLRLVHNSETINHSYMKLVKSIVALAVILVMLASCSRSITVQQAASGNYNKCRPIR